MGVGEGDGEGGEGRDGSRGGGTQGKSGEGARVLAHSRYTGSVC